MSTDLRHKYHAIHKEVYECQFKHFGRATTPAQTEIAQGIFADRLEQGLLEEKTTEQPSSCTASRPGSSSPTARWRATTCPRTTAGTRTPGGRTRATTAGSC